MVQNGNELMHYGVLGMKWGIRRYQPYSVKPRGSGKGGKEIIKDIEKKVNPDKEIKQERAKLSANRRHLSDKDLQNAITRLEKEKKLKELTDADVHIGRLIARQIYADYGKRAVTVFTTAATVSAGMAVAKKFGVESDRVIDLARTVAKVKGK